MFLKEIKNQNQDNPKFLQEKLKNLRCKFSF